MNQKEGYPAVTRSSVLDMQVCVPKDWPDDRVLRYAETSNPCGTEHGWIVRTKGSNLLNSQPERAQCNEIDSHCHIMLDA